MKQKINCRGMKFVVVFIFFGLDFDFDFAIELDMWKTIHKSKNMYFDSPVK